MCRNGKQEVGDSNTIEKTFLVKCGIPPQHFKPPCFIRGPRRPVPPGVCLPFPKHRTLAEINAQRACWRCGGELDSSGRCVWCWWQYPGPYPGPNSSGPGRDAT
jgi:hypothetical protein